MVVPAAHEVQLGIVDDLGGAFAHVLAVP